MALYKIADYYPHYVDDLFQGNDFKSYDVYAGTTDDKVGSVYDALVDEAGYIRYIVIDTGFWVFGKKVLLPVGRARLDYDNSRLYALGLTDKDQVEALPAYDDDMVIDHGYEEQVRAGYRTEAAATPAYTADTYSYEDDNLYQTNEQDNGALKLYEERLVSDKVRRKTGDVTIGKVVETETAKASVPIEKERVVVERTTPSGAGQAVAPGTAAFQNQEVARFEVHEETAEIKKEAFVREEVKVRKEVDREVVTAEETLRREELKVDTDDTPTVNR
ncbi:MAG: DUF2382 domain-containing protein [Microcoleaceae cyanobacterium]